MSKKLSLATRLALILPQGYTLPFKSRFPPGSTGKTPAVPFFRDPTHVVPTLRLYRHLLRCTGPRLIPLLEGGVQNTELRWALKASWKAKRPLTSIPRVRTFLERNLLLLSRLSSGSNEDLRLATEDLISTGDHYRRLAAIREAQRAPLPQPRPRLTGGFLRPTLFNPPLPRLKPQPESISMMIHHRLRARENRQRVFKVIQEWGRDMKHEMAFYRDVHSSESLSADEAGGSTGNGSKRGGSVGEKKRRKGRQIRKVEVTGLDAEFIGGWGEEFDRTKEIMQERFGRENRRSEGKFSEELVERVKEAKRRVLSAKRTRAERRKTGSDAPTLPER